VNRRCCRQTIQPREITVHNNCIGEKLIRRLDQRGTVGHDSNHVKVFPHKPQHGRLDPFVGLREEQCGCSHLRCAFYERSPVQRRWSFRIRKPFLCVRLIFTNERRD